MKNQVKVTKPDISKIFRFRHRIILKKHRKKKCLQKTFIFYFINMFRSTRPSSSQLVPAHRRASSIIVSCRPGEKNIHFQKVLRRCIRERLGRAWDELGRRWDEPVGKYTTGSDVPARPSSSQLVPGRPRLVPGSSQVFRDSLQGSLACHAVR